MAREIENTLVMVIAIVVAMVRGGVTQKEKGTAITEAVAEAGRG